MARQAKSPSGKESMRKITFAAVTLLAASSSFGVVSAVTQSDRDPVAPPPWISRDGAVDASKAPQRISVGLPNDLMFKSPDGWGWVDSELFLTGRDKKVIPVYRTETSALPIRYFDRRTGSVTEQVPSETPSDVSETTEVSK